MRSHGGRPVRSDGFCTLLLLTAAACSNAADAKSPERYPPDDPAAIIITALRHPEPLARAAAPVSVLTRREIIESGTSQTDRLDDRFPELTVEPTATGNLIFIRGVGNFTLLPNSDPAVGFAYDGVSISRPLGTLPQFFDLERIELVKGPQGVLYGRNASAGSINLEPRQPIYGDRSASADLSIASRGDWRAETAINLPLGQASAFRLSGAVSRQPAFLKGYAGGPTQQSLRAQVKSALSSDVTVRLAGDFTHIGGVGPGTSYVGNYIFDPVAGIYRFKPSGLPASSGIYAPESQAYRQTIFLPTAGRMLDALDAVPGQSHRFYGAHARLDARLARLGQLTVIPAWRGSDIDAEVSGSPFGYLQKERDRQSSLEVRLANSAGQFDWLAGTFLFHESIDADTMTNLSSALIHSVQAFHTSSEAVFASLTFHANDRIRLSGGLRATVDQKNYSSDGETLAIVCLHRTDGRPDCPAAPLFPLVPSFPDLPLAIPAQPGMTLPIIDGGVSTGAIISRTALSNAGRLTDRSITWRVGAEFDLGARTLAYANATSGYRPGGFNAATGFETFQPERIIAYTLGLRSRQADDKLEFNLEAFWWDYRDQQVSALRPDLSTPARNANITENIGNSRIRGLEGDARFQPWRDTQVRAVVQYLDAHYRSFSYVYANLGVPPLTGCETSLDAATNLYTVDCRSKQPFNSPRWSLNFDARQSFSVGRLVLTALAQTRYRSARNVGFAFLPEQRVSANWTSDAQVIAAFPRDRLELAAFVRNIEGKRTPEFMIYHPVSNALVESSTTPRQFGLRAWLRF